MAASDYELKILTYDFVDATKKQIECRFDWGGLAGTERDYTEKLEVFVRYHVVNNAGERRIDREDPATTITAIPGQTEYVYYWDVPERCIEVEMKVVAYSKMMNSNGNEVPHWNVGRTIEKTTDWLYCGESNKPDKADTPTVTQNPRLGSQVVLELTGIIDPEGANKDVKKVEFQILSVQNDEDDGTILSGQHEATVSSFNTCRYIMPIGNAYGYRFRARLWASKYGSVVGVENPWVANASPVVDIPGEWSDLTEIIHGAPNSPEILDMKKQNRTQVLISLKKSGYLHHYQFQVASTMDAFTRMDTWELEHPDLIEDDSARQAARELPPPILDEFVPDGGDTESILYTVTQLPTGRLFYRVRAVSAESGGFYSGWSAVFEYKFSEELQKPIVWMNTPFASVGDNSIILNIMHNSPTGTQTTGAIIYYRINSGVLIPYPHEGIIDPPASGSNVYQVAFPITDFSEECAIYWQARTAEYGEAGQDERNWSPLSEGLIFWVYEKPVLNITFPDIPQDEWIPAVTEENAQTIPVVSQFPFHFRIEPVLSGDQMITSYFVRLMACEAYGEYDGYGNKRFVNKGEVLYQFHDNSINVDKYLSVTDCSLANGQRYILNVSAYVNTGVTVEAEAMFTVNIAPSDYVIEAVVGQNRENVSMIINPAAVRYEEIGQTKERIYVNDILLSIYRKNQDGTMVAIAENFENQDSVFVTDPHPNLMKNSYRIVGRDKNSGAMTFVDTPEYKMDCTDIIIQWDENVHFTDVEENSLPAEYAGNTLRLPYNIDVSESANIENSMVNYVGRKNPVSYYGTQTGYTATWNTVIPKYDRDTIALLRKLQVYPGDVYVREPSGTGYWAHVTVSFPINHVELTVSVSISITRVEGGM